MRQWKKKVTHGEAGRTLEQLLRAEGFTKKEISRLKFQKNGMTVNGTQCRSTQVLSCGQEIRLNFMEEGRTAAVAETEDPAVCGLPSLCILYEDADLLIVNKPSGLPCHPGRGHYCDHLGYQVQRYCAANGEAGTVRMIGRLDKDTSGAVVFAKHQIASAKLWKQRESGILQKKYLALVHGSPEQTSFTISLPIGNAEEKNRMKISESGKHAVTECKVLKEFIRGSREEGWREQQRGKEKETDAVISLVQCSLQTGRTHQIRVHMAAVGHPVLGDPFYGILDEAVRLCLHAERISLIQPFTGKKIEIQIPVKGIPFQ